MSKKIVKKKQTVSDLKKLSFSDLYSMYMFVNAFNNATFGKKVRAKDLFRVKVAELEAELYSRVFGVNPFALDKAETAVIPPALEDVKGEDPLKVIESFKQKTFIVATNEERK